MKSSGVWCIYGGNGRFPDNHFPGQNVSRTDVSRTICINNFEYFAMFM